MNIWYLNHYAGTKNSPKEGRSYYLSKGLVNAGENCSVITSSFHHLQREAYVEQEEKVVKKDIDGIPFLWLKTPHYKGNGISRIKNMLSYAYACWKNDFVKSGFLEKPDVIIITSVHPFHIFAGIKWAKKYNAKLVFEIRDIWPLSLNLLLGVSKRHPLSIVLSVIERIGYRKADLITSVLPNALEYMEPKGVSSERFLYIPNGFDDSFTWSNTNIHQEELTKIRRRYSRLIMHTGSMGEPNGLEILVKAANACKSNNNVAFVFIGDGSLKTELVTVSNSEHIYFFPSIPKNQIMSALSFADICYCGAKNLPELYKYGVSPNKVFDYMAAKKYVLLGIDSPNNPVELANSGFCFSPTNENTLYGVIQNIVNLKDSELQSAGENGYNYLLREHTFNNLAVKLINKLCELKVKNETYI